MISTIQHLALVVRDLDATRKFFVENFDYIASEPQDWSGPEIEQLTQLKNASVTFIHLTPKSSSANTTTIAVQVYNEPVPPPGNNAGVLNLIGYRHIGFLVDDIEASYAKLKKDWEFLSEPVFVSWAKLKTVYFYGPESLIIQLMQTGAEG